MAATQTVHAKSQSRRSTTGASTTGNATTDTAKKSDAPLGGSTTQAGPKLGSKHGPSATELDIFAAEFAKLVERYRPSRQKRPADWLDRLPNEAFKYYDRGLASFGRGAHTPIERRGRLYLMHTALLFMWMSWGKDTARRRFKSTPDKGTRRAASLVTLEHYKRAGIIARYEPSDWFFEPVSEWTVAIINNGVNPRHATDPSIKSALRTNSTITRDVQTLTTLRDQGAVPKREDLSLL